jgi:hypothetical protein
MAGLSPLNYVRQKFMSLLARRQGPDGETGTAAARHTIYATRPNDEIGDDAFHGVEQELDWIETALGEDA